MAMSKHTGEISFQLILCCTLIRDLASSVHASLDIVRSGGLIVLRNILKKCSNSASVLEIAVSIIGRMIEAGTLAKSAKMVMSVDLVESITAAISVSNLVTILHRLPDNRNLSHSTLVCLYRMANASGSAKKELASDGNIKVLVSVEKNGGEAAVEASFFLQCLECSENVANHDVSSKSSS